MKEEFDERLPKQRRYGDEEKLGVVSQGNSCGRPELSFLVGDWVTIIFVF